MIVEAPMWLLIPTAALTWLLYVGVVLAERRENREIDRQAERRQADHRADEVAEDQAEHVIRHARSVPDRTVGLPIMPAGVPSIVERLDRWEVDGR